MNLLSGNRAMAMYTLVAVAIGIVLLVILLAFIMESQTAAEDTAGAGIDIITGFFE